MIAAGFDGLALITVCCRLGASDDQSLIRTWLDLGYSVFVWMFDLYDVCCMYRLGTSRGDNGDLIVVRSVEMNVGSVSRSQIFDTLVAKMTKD